MPPIEFNTVVQGGSFAALIAVLFYLGYSALPKLFEHHKDTVAKLVDSCAAERKETADRHEREMARFADAVKDRGKA